MAQGPSPLTHPTLFYHVRDLIQQLDPAGWFANQKPLELELGSGDGGFTLQYAQAHPEINLVAVERLWGRIKKIEKRGLRLGLTNIRLLRFEAGYLLKYLMPAGVFQTVHIYFPDPWPKKRHHKKRLINEEFVGLLWRVLKPCGKVYLRTDDAGYHAWMQTAFASNPGFQPVQTPPELAEMLTDFEKEFHAKGLPTLRLAYQKVAEAINPPSQ